MEHYNSLMSGSTTTTNTASIYFQYAKFVFSGAEKICLLWDRTAVISGVH